MINKSVQLIKCAVLRKKILEYQIQLFKSKIYYYLPAILKLNPKHLDKQLIAYSSGAITQFWWSIYRNFIIKEATFRFK